MTQFNLFGFEISSSDARLIQWDRTSALMQRMLPKLPFGDWDTPLAMACRSFLRAAKAAEDVSAVAAMHRILDFADKTEKIVFFS